MKKIDAKKVIFDELDFCFKKIITDTMEDPNFGYSRYYEYKGLTKACYLLDLISFDDMMKLNDNAYETYKGLR